MSDDFSQFHFLLFAFLTLPFLLAFFFFPKLEPVALPAAPAPP